MKKILTVVGARPQFIKSGTLSRSIASNANLTEIMIHTGQHYDNNMSAIFFQEMQLKQPEYSLNIGSASHGAQTGQMLIEIEKILQMEKPDIILVYGDTNSTLAGALAAAKLHIPVAHVEAGLRSFNQRMPEEINRVLTDHVSQWLFCPTETAIKNARHEGLPAEKLHLVGDVMYDAMLFYLPKALENTQLCSDYQLKPKNYILATLHRAETTDHLPTLKNLLMVLDKIASDYPVLLPLHPRTRKVIHDNNLLSSIAHLKIVEPLGFLEMIALEHQAALIVTDSGGVQKEAYFHEVPCITVRTETEWVELVENGWNTLVPPQDFNELPSIVLRQWDQRGTKEKLYGDGNAAKLIVEQLE